MPWREPGWISVAWSDCKPRRSTADLDEMAEDSVDLGRVCDDGENPLAVSTARTDERIDAVDLCDEAAHVEEARPTDAARQNWDSKDYVDE
jgi:hypothetical protein